jgi:hypothetical protein
MRSGPLHRRADESSAIAFYLEVGPRNPRVLTSVPMLATSTQVSAGIKTVAPPCTSLSMESFEPTRAVICVRQAQ